MKEFVFLVLVSVSSLFAMAHTHSETNEIVRGALLHAHSFHASRKFPRTVKADEVPNTWNGFLGEGNGGIQGWTLAEKKSAFDWYLTTLGTTDLRSIPSIDKVLVRTAIAQCRTLGYTNAVASLKALVLNPLGVCRMNAIDVVLDIGPVDDEMTTFVETVMTNRTGYVFDERMSACCGYAQNLLDRPFTNDVQNVRRERAVKMLYRHRYLDLLGTVPLDALFVASFSGYGTSSNRLEFANYVLGHPECSDGDREDFTAITNQLLSSGQPLRWINVGGDD